MVKIGKVEIGKRPLLVGVVTNKRKISEEDSNVADILELRLDKIKESRAEELKQFLKDIRRLKLPLIGTIRKKKGESEKERFSLFREIIPFVDCIDIELEAEICEKVVELAKKKKKTIIISYHNFISTPKEIELEDIAKEVKEKSADIIKIVPFAKKKEDVIRLLNFTHSSSYKPLATFSMGRIGTVSRIVGFLFSSCLSYGFFDYSVAPGQTSIKNLRQMINLLYPELADGS